MAATSAVPHAASPRDAYQQRLDHFRARHVELEQRLAWLGNARFLLFALAFVLFWPTAVFQVLTPFALAVPVLGFIVLTPLFLSATRADRQAHRAIAHYERGLARLNDQWAGAGVSGAGYADENHLYAADLDLFGSGSLFERLCTARTRVGRDTLARWLTAPGTPADLAARQAAVRELTQQFAWREQLVMVGGEVPEGVHTAELVTWAGQLAQPPAAWLRYAALALVALTWGTVIAWAFGYANIGFFVLALLAQGGFSLWVAPRVRHALAGLQGRSLDLFHLTHLLTTVERGTFTAPRLVELQAALQSEGAAPSQRLTRLAQLIEWLDSTKNQLFGIIAPFLLWRTRTAFLVEVWRWQTAAALPRWVEAVGQIEALVSLAGYAFENPDDPFPEVVADGPLFEGTDLGHPLMPRTKCVANDLTLNPGQRLLLVSGSNMSGKSTYLRTAGVNAVLALAGAPVRAKRLRLSPLAIGATLRIQDSLQAGKSRFYAEITRLRQVIDLTGGPLPLLYLFDEILHGTNSHDRRIGTEGILRTLLQRPAIGLVTTHDLALTQIAANLEPLARNVHFEDQLRDGTLHFDYRLRPGVVEHSNALALMRAVGIQVDAEGGEGLGLAFPQAQG
jgi:hypothetical protein